MNINGTDIIDYICNKLKNRDKKSLLYDSSIIRMLRKFSSNDVDQMIERLERRNNGKK